MNRIASPRMAPSAFAGPSCVFLCLRCLTTGITYFGAKETEVCLVPP